MDRQKDNVSVLQSPAITAPFLVMLVLVLLRAGASTVAKNGQAGETNLFLVISVLQLAVILLPCMLYYTLKGRKLASPVMASPIKPAHIIFVIFLFVLFISGSILIKYFYQLAGATTSATPSFIEAAEGKTGTTGIVGVVLSLIAIPAICEELLFRGIILSEYMPYGSFNAVVISAFFFAMLHFSLQNFVIYFFTGLLLGLAATATRTIIAPILIHMASNAFSIYGSDLFLRVTMQKSGPIFVGILVILVFSLSLMFVLSRLEFIFLTYAYKPPVPAIPPKSTRNIKRVFLSPSFLVLLAGYLIFMLAQK